MGGKQNPVHFKELWEVPTGPFAALKDLVTCRGRCCLLRVRKPWAGK